MKRLAMFGVTTVIVGLAVFTAMAESQDGRQGSNEGRGRACDESTLKGAYGFTLKGLRPGVGGAPEQFVGVGVATYDGHGNFTQVDNAHGPSGVVTDRPGWGTYSVNADCSATATLWVTGAPFPIELRSAIVDGGDEIRTATMAPAPIVVSSVSRRVR